MYHIKLTIWERIQLTGCLPLTAPLTEQEQLQHIVRKLALTVEEKDKVGFEKAYVPTQSGPVLSLAWVPEKLDALNETEEQVKFETAEFATLKKHALAFRHWPRDDRSIECGKKLNGAKEDNPLS